MKQPPPGHITVKEAMAMLGIRCRRKILTEYVRYGLLPWPTDGLWYKREDVQAAVDEFARRRARAGMTRPKASR